jgi:hypothetical protein
METLPWSLTAFCPPRGKPLMRFQEFGASADLQQISPCCPALSRPGEEWRCSAGHGARFSLACQAEWAVNVLILAHNRDIGRGGIFHANDMVAGVDMKDFAGDAPRHRRKEKGGALADLLDRHRAP